MHGPFTIATREDLDRWISNIPSVGILMGDFNDTIWATDRRRKRWWHEKLLCGAMHDPAMAYHPNAQADTLHTRKTKRLVLACFETYLLQGNKAPYCWCIAVYFRFLASKAFH
jgi:hypothetical protein